MTRHVVGRPSPSVRSRYPGFMESDGMMKPIYVTEANGYHVGQVLPPDHVYAGCFIQSIRRTKKDGPLASRYMIDWVNDFEGSHGTFVSWR